MGFKKGDPNINRAGRKKFSESFRNQEEALKLMDESAVPIIEKLIEKAKAGNIQCIKLYVERYLPVIQKIEMDFENSTEKEEIDWSKFTDVELHDIQELQKKFNVIINKE